MGTVVSQQWPGNPHGFTPKARRAGAFEAYVPGRLEELNLDLPAALATSVTEVTRLVDAVNSGTRGLPQLEPMARFLLRAEAVASSWMEGLTIGARRLARAEAASEAALQHSDQTALAVIGNIRAIERALAIADDPTRDIAVHDLLDIHAAVLAGTRDAAWGGALRQAQNWIGGSSPLDADYVPPPPEYVTPLMEDLARYISSSEHPALVQAAVAHAQFETIHPFADGNGRAGRALVHLILRRRGVAPIVVPPVSLVLATRARAYVESLVGVRETDGSHDGLIAWIDMFVDATGSACRDTAAFAGSLADWDEQMRQRSGQPRAGSAASAIIDSLPAMPVFTVSTMAQYLGRPTQKVNQAVGRLSSAGVIRQINVGQQRNRAWEARELLDRFTEFERSLAVDDDASASRPQRPVPAAPPRTRTPSTKRQRST